MMKISFKKFTFIHKLIFKNYSILRILQILEALKLNLDEEVLDLGSKPSSNNVSNFINVKKKIIYADKNSQDKSDLNIDLENVNSDYNLRFKYVLLFNVLEHVFKFKNCVKNCYFFLKKDGFLYGTVPFFFRIHGSPNDYFRYTDQAIYKILKDTGFNEIEIKILGGGIFLCFYNSIFMITRRIPFFNNIMYIICILLDFIISIFSKNVKKIYPIGYFFVAKK